MDDVFLVLALLNIYHQVLQLESCVDILGGGVLVVVRWRIRVFIRSLCDLCAGLSSLGELVSKVLDNCG